MAIDIIKGEQYAITGGNPDGGFLDVGAVVGEAADKVLKVVDKQRAQSQVASNRRRMEAEKANRRIAGYLGKMKSGSDIEGLNKEQNKVIKDFLVNKKSTYVQAANKLATMSPGDPGYMEQVDIMNSVNQDITNLSNISKTYKLNQKDLLEDYQENLLSMGDPLRLNQAASIYDPSAIFSLDENGSMIFDVNGQKIDYADFNNPAPKATNSATAILKLTDDVYNSSFRSGQTLNQYKLANIRSQIEEVVGGNPDIARSLIMDNLLTNTPLAIDDENYKDPEKLQVTLVNDIMEGILAASNKGVNDYKIKNPSGIKNGRAFSSDDMKANATRLNEAIKAINTGLPLPALDFKDRRSNKQISFKDMMIEKDADGKVINVAVYLNSDKTSPYYIIKDGQSTSIAKEVLGISM
jgi:hypothetical protein